MKWFFLFFYLIALKGYADPSPVVVCVHGFMKSKSHMKLFEKELKKEGWDVYLWSYPSQMKLIHEHGEDFVKLLRSLVLKHPGQEFHFITHSMGGLILRSALNHPCCPEEAKTGKAVLIAPPNKGVAYGRFLGQFNICQEIAGPYAGRELLTTEWEGFDRLGEFPLSLKVLVIAGTCGINPIIMGKNDGKVGVEETRLKTPHEFAKIFAGHSWICQLSTTVDTAKKFLERKEPSAILVAENP